MCRIGCECCEAFSRQNASLYMAVFRYGHARISDIAFLFQRPLNGSGNYVTQITFEEVEDVRRWSAAAEFEQPLDTSEAVHNLPVLVYQEARRHPLIEDLIVNVQKLRIRDARSRVRMR